MADPRRAQQIIDFDEIERQIRQSAHPEARGAVRGDALADLSRIVGQPAPAAGGSEPVADWRNPARLDPRLEDAMRSLEGFLRNGPPGSEQPPAEIPPPPAPGNAPESEDWQLRGSIPLADGRKSPVDLDEVSGRTVVTAAAIAAPNGPPASPAPVATAHPRSGETYPDQYAATNTSPLVPDSYGHPIDEMSHLRLGGQDHPPVEAGVLREPPRRSRKGLFVSAALLGVAAVGVAGALTFRGAKMPPAGFEPPLVRADVSPIKVGPANPGGIDVPNQNKQVLQRSIAPATPARVVTTEEQPVDVKAIAREPARPRVILPPPAPAVAAGDVRPVDATGTIPAPPSPLGEPRRVRTVTIRTAAAPAGPPGVAPPPAAATPGAAAPVTRSLSLPDVARAVTPPPAPTPVAPVAPAAAPEPPKVEKPEPPAPVAKAKPKPVKKPAPKVAQKPEAPPAAAAEDNPDAPAPTRIAPTAARPRLSAVETPAATPRPAASGGSIVQVGSATSEEEAKSTLAGLRSKFPEFGRANPGIQRAEVNGQTRWRIRAGGLSPEAARDLCASIKGKGGACFVAR